MKWLTRKLGLLVFLIPAMLLGAIILYGMLTAGYRPTDLAKYHVKERSLETRSVRGLEAEIEVVDLDKRPKLAVDLRTPERDAGRSLTVWLVDSFGRHDPIRLDPIPLDADGRRVVERNIPDGALQRYNRLEMKAGRRTVLRASLS